MTEDALHILSKRMSRCAAVFVMAVGFLVLVGWAFDIGALKCIAPGFPAMKANTAVCFLLSGAALWLLQDVPATSSHQPIMGAPAIFAARGIAMFVATVGGLSLLGDLYDIPLAIDELLFRDDTPVGVAGRMSPATGLNFIFGGLALLAATSSRRRWWEQGAVLAIWLIGLLAFIGYLYDAPALYGFGRYSGMAFHTSASFMALAGGLLFLHADYGLMGLINSRRVGGLVTRKLLPVSILVPLVGGWLRLQGQHAGWYGTETGTVLFASSLIVVSCILILTTAASMDRMDTERERTARALQENERLLRQVIDLVPHHVFAKDRDGKFLFANLASAWACGTQPKDIVGRREQEIRDDREHVEKFLRDDRDVIEHRQAKFIAEEAIVYPDGQTHYLQTTKIPFTPPGSDEVAVLGVSVDITERKEAGEALRQSEERFRQLAENIEEVFWIIDPKDKGRMIYASPAYERIWGQSCESLYREPRSWLDAIHPKDREQIQSVAATRIVEGTYDEEYRICRPDGAVRWIHDRAFPIRNRNGDVERVVGIAEDITRRKELEEQFRQAQKMEAVGQLAGGVAHDFNNLLQAILGYSEIVLRQTPDGDPRRGDILEIQRTGRRAAELTRQLLAFGRRQNLDRRIFDINTLIEDLSKMLRRVIGKDIRIDFELARNLDRVLVDAGQIGQIVLNLAVNARDAMPRGGRLTFATSQRTFAQGDLAGHPDLSAGRFVCVAITDTGTGMPPDVLERLFQPFFTTKAPGQGTGLGLATSYGIARQHGGWMDVQSELGVGSSFRLYLPAVERAGDPLPPAPDKTVLSAEQLRGAGQRILFVEDEEVIRTMIQRQLQRNGYVVFAAVDAATAVRQFECEEGNFDLVLTDVVLPDISGLELLENLTARKPGLRVLISSGYTDNEKRWPIILERKWPFLGKPYSNTELLLALRDIFAAA